jgi:hypothetical protein
LEVTSIGVYMRSGGALPTNDLIYTPIDVTSEIGPGALLTLGRHQDPAFQPKDYIG